MGVSSEKTPWKVPPNCSVLHLSPSFLRPSGANSCCFRKGSVVVNNGVEKLEIDAVEAFFHTRACQYKMLKGTVCGNSLKKQG